MRKIWWFPSLVLGFISCTHQEPYPAVRALIQRITPEKGQSFILDSIPPVDSLDVFELRPDGKKIKISASSPIAAASGFNYYLKHYAHCLVTQTGTQVNLPETFPLPEQTVRISSPFKWRYFLNYCTFNYSMGSWNWTDWEKELDWMAMNGINLPLAIIGTEAVWQNTLTQFGFSPDETLEFIVGPAYTAWWLMGNIEGWGGPVSQKWIDDRVILQKKIVNRMHELGMTPVFQGFYSMVPAKLKDKYPNHHILSGGDWAGFQRPATLDPTDSLFGQMAKVYYSELEKLYGKTHFYGGDPFHEGGNTKGINLTASGKAIQEAMQQANPNSVWVLQGWWENPKDELLKGIDPQKTLILDLFAEGRPNWPRRECYLQTPWVWNMLQNFGNKTGMFGRLEMVCTEPFRAMNSEKGKQLTGMGSMPEGIDNNPVMFDALFDMAWRTEAPDMDDWIKNYTGYRYGKEVSEAEQAWNILRKTVYRGPVNQEGTTDGIICARPSLDGSRSWNWGTTNIYYDTLDFEKAWKLLLNASPELDANDAYQYDLVDVTRQALVNRSKEIHRQMVNAYLAKNKKEFKKQSDAFLNLIMDLDSLLASSKEFLLGRWIEGFKQMATSDEERKLFEQNARQLVTIWGNREGAKELHDYAMKQWSGLLSDFYYQRWKMYFEVLVNRLDGKNVVDPYFYTWENQWVHQTNTYPVQTVGNSVEICKRLFQKYASPRAGELYIEEVPTPEQHPLTLDFILKTLAYYTLDQVTLDPDNLAETKLESMVQSDPNTRKVELFVKTRNPVGFSGTIKLVYQWNYYEWTLNSITNQSFKNNSL